MNGTRILLLVPHPDDEVVGCAIALRRAVAAGSIVFGLYLTTGVPAIETLWPWQRPGHRARVERRRAEAEQAAHQLGIAPLAFQPWPSRTLKAHTAAAASLIDAALTAHRIAAVWAPAWEGGHQDHDVANFLASRFAARVPIMEFAEYNFAGGAVHSQQFVTPNGTETVLRLTADDRRLKRDLLRLYRSERGNLRHVGTAAEALRPLARYDYAKPPHDGPLFHERFQWLRFRHPRVDFERPEAVCAALAAAVPASPVNIPFGWNTSSVTPAKAGGQGSPHVACPWVPTSAGTTKKDDSVRADRALDSR